MLRPPRTHAAATPGASRSTVAAPRRRQYVRAHPRQLEMVAILDAPADPTPRTWGGKREGAGRKPLTDAQRRERRSRVPHRARPIHKKRFPVHVTLRARPGLPSFREQVVHAMVVRLLARQEKRAYFADFHVVHYSIQSNHVHVIVEATDKRALRSGVSGLVIAFAKRLNKEILRRRAGKVWADTYHARDLTTPRDVRNTIAYVYNNYLKHGYVVYGARAVDTHSSARLFDGWSMPVESLGVDPRPPDIPRTWLLGEGWWGHHGKIHPRELPRGAW